jgi:hypothetical protein
MGYIRARECDYAYQVRWPELHGLERPLTQVCQATLSADLRTARAPWSKPLYACKRHSKVPVWFSSRSTGDPGFGFARLQPQRPNAAVQAHKRKRVSSTAVSRLAT